MKLDVCEIFPTIISRELFYLVCGNRLGFGIGRQVYACELDKKFVVKIEAPDSFQNVAEWEFWQANQYSKDTAKWLAPCHMISSCGRILVQRRIKPIPEDKMPLRIPVWATDAKSANWGTLDGKPVMCDYGMILFNPSAKTKARKRRGYESDEV